MNCAAPPTSIPQSIVDQVFQQFPEVVLAYQHGSTVQRPTATHGDLDIAILCRADLTDTQRHDARYRLTSALATHTHLPCDIRLLNNTNAFFAFQVAKYGRRLHGSDDTTSQFVVHTLTRYFDYLSLHQFFISKLADRLKGI